MDVDRDPSAARRTGYGSHQGVDGDTLVRPTPAGRYARLTWPRVVEEVEFRWRSRFGDAVIDALRASLKTQPTQLRTSPWSPPEVAPADGFRTRALPRHPMVLHRAGWLDGS